MFQPEAAYGLDSNRILEIAQTPSVERRNRVNSLMAFSSPHFVLLDSNLIRRGEELEKKGFDAYDVCMLPVPNTDRLMSFLPQTIK